MERRRRLAQRDAEEAPLRERERAVEIVPRGLGRVDREAPVERDGGDAVRDGKTVERAVVHHVRDGQDVPERRARPHVEEHGGDVVRVLVDERALHRRTVRKRPHERPHGDARVLVGVAHEDADVNLAVHALQGNAVVATALGMEVEEDAEVVVAEVDVEGAGDVDGLLHLREGVNELVGVRDVERDEERTDVVLARLAADDAVQQLVPQVQRHVPRHRHRLIRVRPAEGRLPHAEAVARHLHERHLHERRGDAQDLGMDQPHPERTQFGEVQLQRHVHLAEVRLPRKLDRIGDVVPHRQTRIAEVHERDAPQNRRARPRQPPQVEFHVHLRRRHHRDGGPRLRAILPPLVEDAQVPDPQPSRKTKCRGIGPHEVVRRGHPGQHAVQKSARNRLLEAHERAQRQKEKKETGESGIHAYAQKDLDECLHFPP